MEAVSQGFQIAATTFHTTSTRPMPRYYPLPLEISTTYCHMASSVIRPSPKSALTSANTLSQYVISSVYIALLSYVSSPLVPPIAATAPYADFDFATATSSLRASSIHTLKCSALILEGPL